MAQETSHPVVLHVYDLSQGLARQLSHSLLGQAIDAIYHTGITVYGTEFWFGGGIERGVPGRTYFGQPMEVVHLGRTEIPRDVFEEFLADVSPNYTAHKYSLMSHNCNNFSDEVAQFLLGKGIPRHILELPQKVLSSPQGMLLAPLLQQLETTLKYSGAPHPPIPLQPASAAPAFAHSRTMSLHAPMTPSAMTPATIKPAPAIPVQLQPGSQSMLLQQHQQLVKKQSPEVEVSSTTSKSTASPPATAASTPPSATSACATDRMKEQVHAEISREFAALMAAGGLGASEAAAAAVRRVMARHNTGSSASA